MEEGKGPVTALHPRRQPRDLLADLGKHMLATNTVKRVLEIQEEALAALRRDVRVVKH